MYGILDEILLVQDHSGWCRLWRTGGVRCGFDVVQCGIADLMGCGEDLM